MLDLIKGSAATLTLFLAYVTFPLVGMIPGLFAPLPAIYYAVKSGKATGAAIVTVTIVVMVILGDVAGAIFYLMQSGIISLALPVFLSRRMGGGRAIAYTVAVNMAAVMLLAGAYGVSSGVNPHLQAKKVIATSISQVAALYEQVGVKGDELKALQQGMEQAGVLIGRIYPALLVVSIACIVGLNLVMLAKFSARLPGLQTSGDFKGFKNPEQLVWVLIVAGFTMLFNNRQVTTAALNLLIVTVSLYFIQGLAIVTHFFARHAVPRFVRVLFYLFLAIQPYLAVVVAALGVFDLWGDFRSPKQQENL